MANKELRALITLAGKVDPSLQSAFMKASSGAGMTSSKMARLQGIASKGMKVVGKAAVTAGKIIATGIGAGTAALGALTLKAAETGDSLVKMRDKTGLTLEELQRLQYISSQVGSNFESLPQAISIMTKAMAAAKKGSKEASGAFMSLGISVKDSVTGKLKPQAEVFKEVLLQLSKIENESERNVLAFQLFGRGAADLFPLLNTGATDIERLASEADRLGLVMSGDTIEKLDELGDTMDRMKLAGKGIGNRLISRLLPRIMPLLDGLMSKLPAVEALIYRGMNALEKLGEGAGPGLMKLLKELMPVFGELGKSIFTNLQAILPFIPMVMQPIMQIFMMLLPLIKALAPIIGFVAKALLVSLGGALRFLMPVLQGFVNIITALLQGLNWLIGGFGKILGINSKGIISNASNGTGSFTSNSERQHTTNPRARRKFALGGIASRPSTFGDGPEDEIAIPLRRNSRNLGLLDQASRRLGVSSGGSPIQINFNPQYYGSRTSEIEAAFIRQKEELQQMLENLLRERERVAYGN